MTYPQLVDAVHKGNYSAEFELYQRLYNYFNDKSYILPYLRSNAADDLFQDTFLIVWTEIQNGIIYVKKNRLVRVNYSGAAFYMTCSLCTYFMAVARNIHSKIIRKEGPAVLIDWDSSKDIIGDPVDEDFSEKERRMQIVDDELGKMSQRCREILTLYYVDGLRLEQILMTREESHSKNGLKTSKSKCLGQLKTNVARRMSI